MAAPELCPELGEGAPEAPSPACGSLLTQSQNPTGTLRTGLALGAPRDPCGGRRGRCLSFLDPGSWPPPPPGSPVLTGTQGGLPEHSKRRSGVHVGSGGHTASCPPVLAPPPLASMSTLRPASPEVQVAGWGHHPRRALGQAPYGCAGLCRSPSVCSGTRGIAGSAENCSGLHPLSWGQAQEPRQGHGCPGWRTGPGAERPVVKPRLCPAALGLDLPIHASGHQHEVLPRCRAHVHPCGQH